VRLETNDPYRRVTFLNMCGTVRAVLAAHPTEVEMVIPYAGSATRLVRIQAPSEAKLHTATDLGGSAEIGLHKVSDDGIVAHWNMRVRALGAGNRARIQGRIHIAPMATLQTDIVVSVTLVVQSPAILTPRRTFAGFVKRGMDATSHITLTTRSSTSFKLMGIETSDPKIKVTKTAIEDGYRLTISIPTDNLGVFEGEVVLTTDIPLEETLKIPVYAHIIE